MRTLRYSINVTLDGCVDHRVGVPDEELHRYHAAKVGQADALLFGRVTYQMMEDAWRPSPTGEWPDWMDDWMIPFARSIDAARKYVVSATLDHVDWNAELIKGDLKDAVLTLKGAHDGIVQVGGVMLPRALADLGLIDDYDFVVQPIVAGHGPSLLAGLCERLELCSVGQHELQSGAVALHYRAASPPI